MFFLLACGPEVAIRALVPVVSVAPEALDVGDVVVPTTASATVFVANGGEALAEVDVSIDDASGLWAVDLEHLSVEPDSSAALIVSFAPTTFDSSAAELVLSTNDDAHPLIRVPLTGNGVYAPVPDIDPQPPVLDFGTVAAGDEGIAILEVHNLGAAELLLGTIQQTGSPAFVALATLPSGVTANGTAAIPIAYRPTTDAGDQGTFLLPSNDPDEPDVSVLLVGNGGTDLDYPVAEIACPATLAPPGVTALDGQGSHDPAGHLPLAFDWSLAKVPVGSQASLTAASDPISILSYDLAGTYEVELVVTNAIGLSSAPTRCVMDAIPLDDLHVELRWDLASADLDLHLARNGADLFDVPDDCSFCNRYPSWGADGESPRLDLDSRSDGGPENINILTPADGDFTVRVHYFEVLGPELPALATVTVWLDGALAWEGSETLNRNEVWEVGTAHWPAGTFGVGGGAPAEASARSCQ